MDNRVIQVPVSLLLDPDHTATTKVICMARRLYPAARPAELEARAGLSPNTIRSGMAKASACSRTRTGPRVALPGALLADPAVGAQAKVLYGILQATPHFREQGGRFTYTSLCAMTRLSRNTLKHAMADLKVAGWVQTTQANQLRPITFTLGTADLIRSQAEAAAAERRLKRARYGGEAIMQEYLSLLIDSDEYTDNARPGFLVNPQTGERLEFDRYYPPHVAFEYNGDQHLHSMAWYSSENPQHLRDLIKAGICLYEGIHLVVIKEADLSLQGMTRKIGRSMPLRNLAGHEPLIDLLELASLKYHAEAAAAEKTRDGGPPPDGPVTGGRRRTAR